MKNTEAYRLTGTCGIYCGECECYKAKDNENLLAYLISKGIPAERLPCPGCRDVEGNCPAIGGVCATYTCGREKGLDFCYECADFPCTRLMPAVDRAEVLPHNMKVYCLCTIKYKGIEAFVQEYPVLKQLYYKGKMAIGQGPKLD